MVYPICCVYIMEYYITGENSAFKKYLLLFFNTEVTPLWGKSENS